MQTITLFDKNMKNQPYYIIRETYLEEKEIWKDVQSKLKH